MNIKEKRKSLGMTQADLATKTGFDQAQISHWETGYRTPSVEQLEKLAEVLGEVDVGQITVTYRET